MPRNTHNQLHDVLTPDTVDIMRQTDGLSQLVEFVLDHAEAPIDPKTSLPWAKPFFVSSKLRNWLQYDQLSFDDLEAEEAHVERRPQSEPSEGPSFTSVFIDGDGWKEINYKYGHDGGDDAIVSLGRHIRETFRPSDHVLRMGGDEFVVLAKDVPSDRLTAFEETIRRRLGTVTLHIAGRSVLGSATAGIASCPMEVVRSGPDGYAKARETIVRADNALVEAKLRRRSTTHG